MDIKIATRQSALALWQANFVKHALEKQHAHIKASLVTFVTKGDKILDTPLAKIGGKGLFVKELEQALLDGLADLAVHSAKDLPMHLPNGLHIDCFLARANPSDAFVSNHFQDIASLPKGATVGTSSLRRKCQLLAKRPDLRISSLRGNVGTRLGRLDAGEYDAIILASSGLQRLGLESRIRSQINFDVCLPAVAQGALAVESRMQDDEISQLLAPLACLQTTACVRAERSLNRVLEGGCQVPIAGLAQVHNDTLMLEGRVFGVDGKRALFAQHSVNQFDNSLAKADALGEQVAHDLLAQGARDLLAEFNER